MNALTPIAGATLAVFLAFIGSIWYAELTTPDYGVALPQAPAVFETSLQNRISAVDTSMTLVSNSVRGGSSLSGYQCFTIDEGRTDAEYVCGTISGTSVSNLARGIDPLNATSTNSALRFAHRVGATVKITDFPVIQRLRNLSNGAETFPNPLFVDVSTSTIAGLGTSTIPTKEYVDFVGSSGCSNASETARGCVELATTAEAAAGTSAGATGARLALPVSMCNSTSSAAVLCVITSAAGKISQTFFDLTAYWAYSQLFATNATSTNATTTTSLGWGALSYRLPSSAPTSINNFLKAGATSPYQLEWAAPTGRSYTFVSTSDFSGDGGATATSTALTIPAGIITASSTITVMGNMNASSNGSGATSCSIRLRTSTGALIVATSASTAVANGELNGSFTLKVLMNNSVTSQTSIGYGHYSSGVGGGGTMTAAGSFGTETTSSIDFSGAITLALNILGGSNNTNCDVTNYTIVVIP